jgi:outer membrane protein assembly factor BamB
MMKLNKHVLVLAPALVALLATGGCAAFKKGKPKTAVLGERVPILVSENDAGVEPSIADVEVLLPAAVANDTWSQPGGNSAKSMGHLALGGSPVRAWDARIAGVTKSERLAAAPVVSGGTLYAMDTTGTVHAFDSATGAKRWSVSFGGAGKKKQDRIAFGGGVSVDGAMVYATNGLGDIAALNAANGSTVWKKRPGGPLRGAPSVAGGSIYAMSQDNQIFALNAADGTTQWSEAAAVQTAGVFGVAAPAVAQATVVSGFSSGDLIAYRYENGRTLWGDALSRTSVNTSVSTLSDIDADPVIDQGRVFAIGQGGRMVSLELVTGQRIWELNIAGISTPWVAGEWVFVVTDEARLLCVARATGKVRWSSQLQRYRKNKSKNGPVSWTGPVLAGERLILANSEGGLSFVSPADGKVVSSAKVGAPVFLPPVVANSTLYILDNSGRISAFR